MTAVGIKEMLCPRRRRIAASTFFVRALARSCCGWKTCPRRGWGIDSCWISPRTRRRSRCHATRPRSLSACIPMRPRGDAVNTRWSFGGSEGRSPIARTSPPLTSVRASRRQSRSACRGAATDRSDRSSRRMATGGRAHRGNRSNHCSADGRFLRRSSWHASRSRASPRSSESRSRLFQPLTRGLLLNRSAVSAPRRFARDAYTRSRPRCLQRRR